MAEDQEREPKAPSRVVDVHYRRLDRDGGAFPEDITLAESLRRALRSRAGDVPLQRDVKQRVQDPVPGKPGDIRCWNNIQAGGGIICGTTCLYRPQELQAVIEARHARGRLDAYPLDQIDEAGGRDFLRAIAYWMAADDHFYLIQSPALQTGAMENYFDWLLRKAGLLTEDHAVRMQVALDREAIGGDLEDLTSINVGGMLEAPAAAENDGAVRFRPGAVDIRAGDAKRVEKRRVGRLQPIKDGWDLLHRFIPNQRSLEEIEEAYRELKLADPDAALGADLEFFVSVHKRNEDGRIAKQKALQAISNGLRDLPDGTVTARGKDGMIKGQEIRLKAPRRVRLAPPPEGAPDGSQSTLLDLNHAFDELQVVHRRYIEDGKIE